MRTEQRGKPRGTGSRERTGPRRPEPTLRDKLRRLVARLRPLVDNDRAINRRSRGSYIENNMNSNLAWRAQQRAELVRGLRRRFTGR